MEQGLGRCVLNSCPSVPLTTPGNLPRVWKQLACDSDFLSPGPWCSLLYKERALWNR